MKTFLKWPIPYLIFKFDGKVSWGTGVAGTRENREGRKGTRDGERKGEKQKF